MKRGLLAISITALFVFSFSYGQTPEEQKIRRAARGKEVVSQEELISLSKDILYPEALQMLNEMSKKFLKKPIVDASPISSKINVDIRTMYWRDALEVVLRTNGLWYNETADIIQVVSAGAAAVPAGAPPGAAVARVDTGQVLAKMREVTISAIFMDVSQSRLRESGISFSLFRGKDLNLGIEFLGEERVTSQIFGVTLSPTSKKLAVNIDAAIRIFESEGFGEVIARPQVTVRSGSEGKVQIGSDISIKERDFAGNLIDKFYPTGTILKVTPKVYSYGPTELVDLDYSVERSTPTATGTNITVSKTSANGRLMLLNGEEGYVAGLYTNEELTRREGIPILKDLPGWVLGLRYIFGYDNVSVNRRELLVLLKAELVPKIDDRIKGMGSPSNVIEDKLKEMREDTQKRTIKKQ